jgi:hypothetical protein
MTHLMVEDDLQAEIESLRMDFMRTWPDNLNHALAAQLVGEYPAGLPSRRAAIYLIAQLTLAIENGVIE